MASIDRNGMYREMKEGSLSVINSDIELGGDMTDAEIQVNTDIANFILNNDESGLKNYIKGVLSPLLDIQNIRLSREFFERINNITGVDVESGEVIIEKRVDPRILRTRVDNAIKFIRRELISQSGIEQAKSNKVKSLQNSILETLVDIYRDPRTLIASTTPTTMDPVNDVVSALGLEKLDRNHFNAVTDIFVNKTTAVGKTDIGISAVAQKAFYALTYYYNTKFERGESVASYFSLKLPTEWGGKTILSLGFPGQRVNQATINALIDHVMNNFTPQSSNYTGQDGTYKYIEESSGVEAIVRIEEGRRYLAIGDSKDSLKWIEVGMKIGDVVPTSPNSSIISSSTD